MCEDAAGKQKMSETEHKTGTLQEEHSPSSYTSLAVWSTSVTVVLLPPVAT